MNKHPTAGGFVFCRFPGEWRLGLIEHPRMKVMACPGGHVENDETPAEAAVREIGEETGLSGVWLVGFPARDAGGVSRDACPGAAAVVDHRDRCPGR